MLSSQFLSFIRFYKKGHLRNNFIPIVRSFSVVEDAQRDAEVNKLDHKTHKVRSWQISIFREETLIGCWETIAMS